MIDGRFYVIDTNPDKLVDDQPFEGFTSAADAHDWVARRAPTSSYIVRQYASLFANEARVEGLIDGVCTVGEAVADNAREHGTPDSESVFDGLPIDQRVARLGQVSLECVRFEQPDGHEGEYARVMVRFPTGDALVVLPRPDGTLVLDWAYPSAPREVHMLIDDPKVFDKLDLVFGAPMYEQQKGCGPVLGYVVGVAIGSEDITATIRLTHAGRQVEIASRIV